MASKRSKDRKKAQKAQRNARDMQTPGLTEPSSDSESQAAESSTAPAVGQRARHRDKKGKQPLAQKARFARSPTREGDFASNAGDYDSNDEHEETNHGMSEESDHGIPEDQPPALFPWVKQIIERETSNESERMAEFFRAEDPQYEQCVEFFERLNGLIREANQTNNVSLDAGIVDPTFYKNTCSTWRQVANEHLAKGSTDDFWDSFNQTRNIQRHFTRRNFLPKTWILSQALAEEKTQTRNPMAGEDTGFTYNSENGQPSPTRQLSDSESSSVESDIDVHSDEPTGLDALEARTRKQQRQLNSAKVLYWWPKGTGSQIFVRYGSRSNPVYRIRAGSYESYNPSRVERVLTSQSRGNAKVVYKSRNRAVEDWRYKRKHVEDFVGIGWKVEEDDEQGLDPLHLLLPAKGTIYPQTRILVKWKDGTVTLEGRSFIRRITVGSALDGDRVIYQKAKDLETTYRKRYGLDDIEEGDDTESDGSTPPARARSRRYRSEPARYSIPGRQKMKSRYNSIEGSEGSEGSDFESDASTQPTHYVNRRYRSEPAGNPTTSTKRRKAPVHREGSAAKIEQLERKIRQLSMRRSMSPEDRREAQWRPRRRGDRERTA
ncbi:hypothetical protein N7508_006483 [Penicillium antarcticum]|uniref:uncharacterized protein n=1 Tax=Penicillium antarcticum TaxID=416450 RepID=UPI0023954699|nr:uncharacterized protein N7508_006483 [Penicillium antarcticum]KAJ5301620.1 hypothetical protein N7508_006483 [Penicillium antarcticum]